METKMVVQIVDNKPYDELLEAVKEYNQELAKLIDAAQYKVYQMQKLIEKMDKIINNINKED